MENSHLVNFTKYMEGGEIDKYEDEYNADCGNKDYEYIPYSLNPTSRTIAIGDIHGDLDISIELLKLSRCIKKVTDRKKNVAKIIDKNNREVFYEWIGDDTQVVQVGDQIDRCRPT